MAYQKVSSGSTDGPIVSWETKGQVVEGVCKGTRFGKTFKEKDGTEKRSRLLLIGDQAVSMPTVIANAYDEGTFKTGQQVRITYTGKPSGKTYKAFDIEVDDSTPVLSAGGQSQASVDRAVNRSMAGAVNANAVDPNDPIDAMQAKLAAATSPMIAEAKFQAIRRRHAKSPEKLLEAAKILLESEGVEAA